MNVSAQKLNRMIEQELKNIWNSSSRTTQISIETNQLIMELSSKVNNMQKKIRIRDFREISASVIGIIIFSYLLYEIPFPITKISCAFSIIWFVFVIYKFRKSKKQNTTNDLSSSLTDQLGHQEATMQQQAVLLSSSAYWYAIPPFVINFLFILGVGNPSDYNWTNSLAQSILPLTITFKIVMLIGLAFFYAFIIWINKRVVTKEINPLLKSIRSMQQQLTNE